MGFIIQRGDTLRGAMRIEARLRGTVGAGCSRCRLRQKTGPGKLSLP